jgi:DHA1 family multidrug resistance protein-like MFS transporter
VATRVLDLVRANRILLTISLVTMVSQVGFGMVIPVLPLFVQTFGGTEAAVGAAVAAFGLARLLFDLPMGHLTERAGRRRIMVIGEVITAVGSLICGLAATYPQLLVFRFIAGIGSATVLTVGPIIVADISKRENRGRMMSAYSTFFQLAVGVGPVVGGMISVVLGPRAPFFGFAALGALAAAVCYLWLPETRHLQAEFQLSPTERPGSTVVLRKLLSSPGFVLVGLIGFAATLARTGGIFSVVPSTAYRFGGLNASQVGLAITIANLLNFGTVSGAGVLADRFGRKATIVPGGLLVALGFVLFSVQSSYVVFVAGTVLWGMGSALYNSPASAYAADMAPAGANGTTMGIYRALSDLGYAVGPLILGFLADRIGPVGALLTVAATFVVIVVPFLLYAPETRRATKAVQA